MPHAILFDLDDTLIDRTQSIGQYAARFQRDFADYLAPIAVPIIATAAGLRAIWLRGVHPWPPDYPAPQWQIGALIELVGLVQQERNPAT